METTTKIECMFCHEFFEEHEVVRARSERETAYSCEPCHDNMFAYAKSVYPRTVVKDGKLMREVEANVFLD